MTNDDLRSVEIKVSVSFRFLGGGVRKYRETGSRDPGDGVWSGEGRTGLFRIGVDYPNGGNSELVFQTLVYRTHKTTVSVLTDRFSPSL